MELNQTDFSKNKRFETSLRKKFVIETSSGRARESFFHALRCVLFHSCSNSLRGSLSKAMEFSQMKTSCIARSLFPSLSWTSSKPANRGSTRRTTFTALSVSDCPSFTIPTLDSKYVKLWKFLYKNLNSGFWKDSMHPKASQFFRFLVLNQ